MTSAGNDVVSLAAIDITRTNQHKFYSKILSDSEIPLYNEFSLTQIPFEVFVWLLWSIKESAYKFLQRDNPELLFTPVKFVVTEVFIPIGLRLESLALPLSKGGGFRNTLAIKSTVQFAERTLHSCSLLYDELIHTVVNHSIDFDGVYWGVKKIEGDDNALQSAEVRSFLLERLTKLYDDGDFNVDKNSYGCPVVLNRDINITMPVSFSHHGCFVGYSFPPLPCQKFIE